MEKSLYSLMLMDEVVAEIDKLAARQGTNRSNLVNRILADYVSVSTPEKEIEDVFRKLESLISETTELVPFFSPHQLSMSMKSSLQYKYRPTVRYQVQLYRNPDKAFGELTVNFRTQSQSLLTGMAQFFMMWKRLEDAYISDHYPAGALQYQMGDGKFIRTLALPEGRNYKDIDLGREISSYIGMFDKLMKGWLAGTYSERDLERSYVDYLNSGIGLI
ncbi:MAG: hypothetical protein IJM08_03015 [Firmicutes bacterium]|nr:hypothetical protein [Bacillota bacterium]